MPKKSPRIPDFVWENHKAEIIGRYLRPNSTLAQVISYMDENHAFRASPSQYSKKLKDWGVAKNTKAGDWESIGLKLKKRKLQGKDSDVFREGKRLSPDKVDRETARYLTFTQSLSYVEDVATPEGFSVRTPSADSFSLVSRGVYIGNLPSLHFSQQAQKYIQYLLSQNASVCTVEPVKQQTLLTAPSMSMSSSQQKADPLPRYILDALCRDAATLTGKRSLAPYLSPDAASDHDSCSDRRLSTLEHRYQSPDLDITFLIHCFISLSTNNLLSRHQNDMAFNWLIRLLGPDFLVGLCRSTSPLLKIFRKHALSYAIGAGDNSLAKKLIDRGVDAAVESPPDRATPERVPRVVEHPCEADPTTQLSRRDIFASADEQGYSAKTRPLPLFHASLPLAPDPEVCIEDAGPAFPLIDAVLEGSRETVRRLLAEGARVDDYAPEYYGTALQAATALGHTDLVELLLQHGADMNAPAGMVYEPKAPSSGLSLSGPEKVALQTPVEIAAEKDNVNLVRFLLARNPSAAAFPSPVGCLISQCHDDPTDVSPSGTGYEGFSTAIQYAARNGNVELATMLLAAGVHPDSRIRPYHGDTPLQIAARRGDHAMVSILLTAGADVNAAPGDLNGRTALQGAAEQGHISIIKILLQHGALVNALAGSTGGVTALQAASQGGHSFLAGYLYAMGADVHAAPAPRGGKTAVQAAAAGGHCDLLSVLISLGGDVNAAGAATHGATALQFAMSRRNFSMVHTLVKHGADVNAPASSSHGTPLEEAAKAAWLDGAGYLLCHGARVNDGAGCFSATGGNQSALGWAISLQDSRMVRLLLASGADALSKSPTGPPTALVHALYLRSSYDIVRLLLETDGILRIPWDGAPPLAVAIGCACETRILRLLLDKMARSLPPPLRDEHLQRAWDCFPSERYFGDGYLERDWLAQVFRLLHATGVEVDSPHRSTGTTLLQRIVYMKHKDPVIALLLEHGAHVNVPATGEIGTPLQEAILWGDAATIDLLLEHGADVNAPPARRYGLTALQAAAVKGMIQVAITLLEKGADVAAEAAPIEGRTAIDGAAEQGRLDMLQLLLNAYQGRDLRAVCLSAAQYAKNEGHAEIADWLVEYPDSLTRP